MRGSMLLTLRASLPLWRRFRSLRYWYKRSLKAICKNRKENRGGLTFKKRAPCLALFCLFLLKKAVWHSDCAAEQR